MKQVIVYETNGKRFDDIKDAEAYEALCERVESIMSKLAPRTNDVNNGYTWGKHDPHTVQNCFRAFCEVCAETIPSFANWFIQTAENTRHISHISRILSDYDREFPILNKTYFRFFCIDFEKGLEFEQPYWVTHQDEFFSRLKVNGNKGL